VAVVSEKLQKLQNRAARILMWANYDANIDELFRALAWRKLTYQLNFNQLLYDVEIFTWDDP